MKRKLTIAVLLILLAVFMAGACFFAISTLSDYRSWRVITLKDLSDDDQLRAVPQNLVVVAFWEGTTGASAGEPIAVIPYTFTYDSGFTFCWEADYPTLNEYMALHFSGGRELVRIDAGDGCVTEVLPSGAYEMRFYRDDVASLVPIFVRPYPDAADPSYVAPGSPGPGQFNITTNECLECVLTDGNFYRANLVECDLTGASFVNASLYGANLTDAIIDGVDFDGANLSLATWTDGRTCADGSTGTCD